MGLKISVVVPAHNEELLLPRCLDALLAQDYPDPIEIVVVDNASTDGTRRAACRPGVTVIQEPERDYCCALIRGFGSVHGEIIALTDADTLVPRDWISTLVREYEGCPDLVAVGGNVVFDRPNLKGWFLAKLLVPAFNWLDRHDPRGPHLWGANLSVRREAFEAVGGWNPAFSLQVDSDLSERLREVGRVAVLANLKVRTSTRRWNRALLTNLFVYVSNFLWMKIMRKPLWRDFPIVREGPSRAPRYGLRYSLGVGVFILGLIWLGEGTFGPRGSLFGKTYWHADTRLKVVALTFDDGPNEPYTSRVLDILRREHVRATFFLVGENIRRFRATAARIVREGHAIGNHTDHHTMPFALQSVSEMKAQVSNAEETIWSATGEFTRLFRPPQGLRSPWLMHVLEGDSLITVTWDDAPGDWDPMPTTTLIDRTVLNAHPGSIILLHDGMNVMHGIHADQSTTVEGLDAIIRRLRAEGYRFVTVPALLHCSPTLPEWPPVRRPNHA
jgi:peptidoglycan/xylan/chitin deacetylase (PgdA/CDA1 family)/glycosyltransferase involved in cell wall biosynthesis